MRAARALDGETVVVTRHSPGTVDGTLNRLLALAKARGVRVFAIVDHSGAAARAGLRMPDTKVVLLGRPEAGTPVMLAAPLAALDLPIRVLIAAGPHGGCEVSYHPAADLAARHDLDPELVAPLEGIGQIIGHVTAQASARDAERSEGS